MSFFESLLSKLSQGTGVNESTEFDIIGNCFGFLSVQNGVGVSTFIWELANIAAEKGLHTCIIDASPLSSYYLDKCKNCLGDGLIPSIMRRYEKHTTSIAECLINYSNYLKVLCFGDTQFKDTFQLDKPVLDGLFNEIKDAFDLVLVDIKVLPWLEPTLAALNICSTVYTVLGFNADILGKLKTDNFLALAGLESKTREILIMGTPPGFSVKKSVQRSLPESTVHFEIPYISEIKERASGLPTILNHLKGKYANIYAQCINDVFSEITLGISGKELISNVDNNTDSADERR